MSPEYRKEALVPVLSTTVNGEPVQRDIQANQLLVTFLREDLRLIGAHIGCDTSQCGACVVHVDGLAIKSCTMFAIETQGKEIKTIEGQANADGSLNDLQQAFQTFHGLQCGFCTPGMIMSAIDLLRENPKPTEADIRAHLEGNLCRCTGYQNIVKAIYAASGQNPDELSPQEGI